MSRKYPKTQIAGIGMSRVDAEALRGQAQHGGLTISELIHRRITGQPVTAAPIRRPCAGDLNTLIEDLLTDWSRGLARMLS